jgi:hypothetical protein
LAGRHGLWRSLVARVVRDDEAAGSNPVSPTQREQTEADTGSMTLLPFNLAVVLLVVGTLLLMATQVLPVRMPWRCTTLTTLTVAGLGCVLAGYTGIGPNANG